MTRPVVGNDVPEPRLMFETAKQFFWASIRVGHLYCWFFEKVEINTF